MKRGQTTLFIIIGIIILAAIILLGLWRTSTINFAQDISLQEAARQTKNQIETCIEEKALQAITDMKVKAGYPTNYKNILYFANQEFPIMMYNNQDLSLSLKEVEENLKQNYLAKTKQCTELFKQEKYAVTLKNIDAEATIYDEEIQIITIYEIRLESNQRGYTLAEDHQNTQDHPFGKLYKTSTQILETLQEGEVCFTCILDIGIQNNIQITIDIGPDDGLFFILQHKKTGETLNFAVKIK